MVTSAFKKGSIELLSLLMMQEKDIYGYQLIQMLAQRSGGKLTVQEGSLYPLLYRMMEAGYISCRDVTVQTLHGRKRSRVLYHMEPKGWQRLRELKAEYDQVQEGIQNVFQNSAPVGYGEEAAIRRQEVSEASKEETYLSLQPEKGIPFPAGG